MHTVVVLAGGYGTRVSHLTGPQRPKALLSIAGRPFIDFKMAELAASGADRVIFLIGHGGSAIKNHVGDGASYGLRVEYLEDGRRPLGTGGSVRAALSRTEGPFWVTYGDTLLAVPVASVEAWFAQRDVAGCMTVLRNESRWESSNVSITGDLVARYEKGSPPGVHDYIDYGMLLLTEGAFTSTGPYPDAFELSDLLNALIEHRALGVYVVTERFWDIGTEEAYRATAAHLETSGLLDALAPYLPVLP